MHGGCSGDTCPLCVTPYPHWFLELDEIKTVRQLGKREALMSGAMTTPNNLNNTPSTGDRTAYCYPKWESVSDTAMTSHFLYGSLVPTFHYDMFHYDMFHYVMSHCSLLAQGQYIQLQSVLSSLLPCSQPVYSIALNPLYCTQFAS